MSAAVYGYGRGDDPYPHAAAGDNAEEFLCGRPVVRIMPSMPFAPPNLHPECRAALFGRFPRTITCPDCGGRVETDEGGRVGDHGVYVVRGGKPEETDTPCTGAGESPGGES